LADGAKHVFQLGLAHHGPDARTGGAVAGLIPRSGDEKAGGDDAFRRHWLDHIAGELFADELVVGLVSVERIDDIIAVTPGMVTNPIVFETLAFAEAHHIEPMPRPAFAMLRRSEQPIDHALEGIRPLAAEKSFDFLGSGREANEVEVNAANKNTTIGFAAGFQSVLFQLGAGKSIDRIL
jgi:hypothetical protein